MKHKTEDYKINAVKYYINNEVSMDEVCEILTWKRLQLHEKPVIFLNVNEFWTPFLNLLLELEKTGFLVNHLKSLFSVVETTDQIMSLLLESQRNASRE